MTLTGYKNINMIMIGRVRMHEDLDNYIFGFSISILYILGAIKIDSPYYILLSALLLGVMFLMKVYSSSFMEKIGLEVSDKVSEPLIKTTAIAVNFFILFFLLSRLFDFQLESYQAYESFYYKDQTVASKTN